ncbi:MAG: hypothetical protein PHE02_14315 [Lachnospiraceae bacterium]|nr:hypothetical protein [Lachnospiraceae bacterium]
MKKLENIFWGLFWIVCAIFLLMSKMGYFAEVSIISLLLTVFFVAWLVKSMIRRDIAGALFPIAFIGIIYADQLGIQAITPWPILCAALLGSIGISMIYHPRHHYHYNEKDFQGGDYRHYHYQEGNEDVSSEEGSDIKIGTRFGGSVKYIKSDDFKRICIDNQFAGMKVYFDDAIIQQGEAEIHLDGAFSGTELFIPKSWNVIQQLNATFGGIEEKNRPDTKGVPKVYLTGSVAFGGVTIIYI